MARQNKQGLDYFPLNVFMDDKIELLEAECGLSGFAVYIKLLQKIYSEGYFYYLGQDELLLTSKRINVDINSLNVIIDCCIKRNLFNDVLFDKYKILTSQGIQKRFIEATLRRKEIEIVAQYWLNVEYDSNRVKIIDVDINPENVDIKKQSKVKESKVNKSKELSCDDFEDADIFKQAWKEYPSGCKRNAETEFNWLKKQHNDWKKVLPLLKDSMIAYKQFVKSQLIKKPDYTVKHMQGWLTERRWEMYQLKEEIQEPELEFVGGFNDN